MRRSRLHTQSLRNRGTSRFEVSILLRLHGPPRFSGLMEKASGTFWDVQPRKPACPRGSPREIHTVICKDHEAPHVQRCITIEHLMALFFFERLRLHVRHSVVRSQPKASYKKTNLAADGVGRRGTDTKIGESAKRHAPEKPNRANQACSSNLETNPARAREEPRGAPNATGPGLHREWLIWDVDVGNALSATRQYTRGNAREERARRLRKTLLALLAPQGEAILKDLSPIRRCGRAKLKVNSLQDTTLCDNLLGRPG